MPKTGNVTAVIPKHPILKKRKQRQDKAEKHLKEIETKRKYRNKVKINSQTTPINDLEKRRFNGRPIFFASKDFLCSFCTFKPLVLAAITLNVVLAQSDLEFFVLSNQKTRIQFLD
jgi:hypothetical protein